MELTTMTRSWKTLTDKITVYILNKRKENEELVQKKNKCPYTLYNEFINATGTVVEDTELAVWCLGYISKIVKMPLNKLQLAAKIDGLI